MRLVLGRVLNPILICSTPWYVGYTTPREGLRRQRDYSLDVTDINQSPLRSGVHVGGGAASSRGPAEWCDLDKRDPEWRAAGALRIAPRSRPELMDNSLRLHDMVAPIRCACPSTEKGSRGVWGRVCVCVWGRCCPCVAEEWMQQERAEAGAFSLLYIFTSVSLRTSKQNAAQKNCATQTHARRGQRPVGAQQHPAAPRPPQPGDHGRHRWRRAAHPHRQPRRRAPEPGARLCFCFVCVRAGCRSVRDDAPVFGLPCVGGRPPRRLGRGAEGQEKEEGTERGLPTSSP